MADSSSLMDKFNRYMVPIALEEPIIVRGYGTTVEDINGRKYLDFAGGPGVLNFGHCNPQIIEAIQNQIGLLMQSPGKYITPASVNLAAELARITPKGLTRSFFCNSGAEANEGALKLAKKFSFMKNSGSGIISFENSFHGRLTHALAVTGQTKYKHGLDSYLAVPGILHVPYPNPLRTPGGRTGCIDYVLSIIRDAIRLRAQGSIAAMICEPIQAVGGVIVPPDDFLSNLRNICNEFDILLIIDEVFTGFGRTGTMFASQNMVGSPDILTTAKAIGGGLPLGAFITTDKISEAFAKSKEHFTTFGGNNLVSCAAGLAALRVIEEENLPHKAEILGKQFIKELKNRIDGLPTVTDVRGKGLLIGVEFSDNDKMLTPRPDIASRVQAEALVNDLLISITGPFNSIIRLSPPLTTSSDEISQGAQILGDAIKRVTLTS